MDTRCSWNVAGLRPARFQMSRMPRCREQLSTRCGKKRDGCEIQVGGQDYLALGMDRNWVTPDYKLLRFASIDDAMRGFTRGLWRVFVMTGLAGVLLAILFSYIASRSISRPLANLASKLESTGETGALWSDFPVDSTTQEVNLLAGALNSRGRAPPSGERTAKGQRCRRGRHQSRRTHLR